MYSKFEKELTTRAKELIEKLKEKEIDANIIPNSLREYQIKVNVNDYSVANIYYSGKKRAYSLVTTEVCNERIKDILEDIWAELDSSKVNIPKEVTNISSNEISIYVDGSFYDNGYGYGFAVIQNNELIFSNYGYVEQKLFREQNNIGGELIASIKAMEWCLKKNITEVNILHDYVGVAKFATGAYKAKTAPTSFYAEKMKQFGFMPKFIKVAGHSNNKWNDFVDALAKKGALSDPLKEEAKVNISNLKELQTRVAEGFADYLTTLGINACTIDFNNLYGSRVSIRLNNKNIYLDIYNSKKRKLNDPYISNASETDKKMLLSHLKAYLFKNNLN